jgi:hypothetical protein
VTDRPDPYYELAEHWPDVKIRIRADLGNEAGQTLWLPDGSIEMHLALDLSKVERRCTLLHEIVHLRRGRPDTQRDPVDEAATIKQTARWLIADLCEFAAALVAYDVAEVARRFDVIPAIVYERLDHLTKSEMEHLIADLTTHAA